MASTMTARTGELWRIGVPDEEWAFAAPRPGRRDLGESEVWERSLVRSRLRRQSAAARRPGLRQGAKGRIAAALVGVTLAVPATEAVTAGTADAAPLASGVLKRGDSGSAVRALQRALGVAADGEFGSATAKAVRAFQRAHGLQADGVVGPLTAAAIGTGTTKASSSSTSKTRSSASGTAADVDLPASTVRALQRALGVAADGAWGPQTRKALRAYQRAQGLQVDGVPGPQTLARLGVKATGAHAATAADEGGDGEASTGTGAGAAIAAARAKIGASYASGATGPSSFDCSGLTQWAMRKAGISLPRTSFAQYGVGSSVGKGAVRAGDLVFFSTAGAGASHVGIATGSSTVISATSHGVMEHSFTSGYWSQHYVGARRVA